jgi:hypothetical protein
MRTVSEELARDRPGQLRGLARVQQAGVRALFQAQRAAVGGVDGRKDRLPQALLQPPAQRALGQPFGGGGEHLIAADQAILLAEQPGQVGPRSTARHGGQPARAIPIE